MTEEEEKNLREWIANLTNAFTELQQGMKLMTGVAVNLERRVAELERAIATKSKIIRPLAARN